MRPALFIFLIIFTFSSSAQSLSTGCYYVKEKSDSTVLATGKKDSCWVDTVAILTVKDLARVNLKKSGFGYALEIILKKSAGEKFRIATAKWVQKKIAIIVSGQIVSVPLVVTEIAGGKLWLTNGASSKMEMKEIKVRMEAEIKKQKN